MPGHQIVTYTKWTPDESPESETRYQFTSASVRFGIQRFYDHFLYSHNGDYVRTDPWYLYARPATNWQIGLDSAVFWRYSETFRWSEEHLPGGIILPAARDSLRRFEYDAAFSAKWVNRPNLHMSSGMARLAYLGTSLVGRGELLVNAKLGYHRTSQDQKDSLLARPEVTIGKDMDNTWKPSVTVLWGPYTNMNVQVELPVTIMKGYGWRATSSKGIADSSFNTERHNGDRLIAGYAVSPIVSPLDGLYVTGHWGQQFDASRNEKSTESYHWRDDSVSVALSGSERKMYSDGSQAALKIDYLSAGSFQPEILLDDYRDFYRHMLSHRQIHAFAGAGYRRSEAEDMSLYSVDVVAGWGLGFLKTLELTAQCSYLWDEYLLFGHDGMDIIFTAKISPRIFVRWRSFEYVQGGGPGWSADSALDACFGPLLSSGQTYLSFEWQLPEWDATKFNGRRPFRASKFISDRRGYFRGRVEIGVLRDVVISFFDELRYRTDGEINYQTSAFVLERNEYGASITIRPLPYAEATASYSTYYDRYGLHRHATVKDLVRIDLRCLI